MSLGNDHSRLTKKEITKGWHWCVEFDGLLVGPEMGELQFCSCWPKDHPVYKTITIHGVNCPKYAHSNCGGYLHDAFDDSPYDVDGQMYCGRCHIAL